MIIINYSSLLRASTVVYQHYITTGDEIKTDLLINDGFPVDVHLNPRFQRICTGTRHFRLVISRASIRAAAVRRFFIQQLCRTLGV